MAMPMLADPNFRQSVTCISEHTPEGAVGIIVNQIHQGLTGRMIFEELGIKFNSHNENIPIHVGGPVHQDELFILHSKPLKWSGSLIINDQLALSNCREILEAIALDQGPKGFVIALGCAGWGPGQLEWEIRQNAWLAGPCNNEIIFRIPLEERWESAIRGLGIDPNLLSDTAGTA